MPKADAPVSKNHTLQSSDIYAYSFQEESSTPSTDAVESGEKPEQADKPETPKESSPSTEEGKVRFYMPLPSTVNNVSQAESDKDPGEQTDPKKDSQAEDKVSLFSVYSILIFTPFVKPAPSKATDNA